MLWRNLWNRFRGRPRGMESELDEELAFHLEMKRADLRAQGLLDEEAAWAAKRSIGNLTLNREEAREAWSFRWAADIVRDVRIGLRTLRGQPGFAAAVTLTLSLGIGLNGIVFTVYNALAYTPWAVRDAARTVQLTTEGKERKWRGFSWPEFLYLREHSQSADGIVAVVSQGVRLRQGEQSWTAPAVYASDNFFDSMGTGFAAGRGFSGGTGDMLHPSAEIVLEYETWQSRFAGSPAIVGQWLEVNGQSVQVVGVAAQGFAGPSPTIPQLWIPGAMHDKLNPGAYSLRSNGSCCVTVFGHLRAGVAREQAQAELETLSAQFRRSMQEETGRLQLSYPSLLANPSLDPQASQLFVTLAAAAILLLLLSCANAANLELARAQSRRREIAVRLSLGADRGRILRQLLAESLLLASLAGLVTFGIVNIVPRVIVDWIRPPEDRISFTFQTDWRVAVFLVGASFAAALLFGLAPALSVIREALGAGLREGGRNATGTRIRNAFLVVQVALCATVLGGASLLVRAMQEAKDLDSGFAWKSLVLVTPQLATNGVTPEQTRSYLQRFREAVESLPGVESAAASSVIPFGGRYTATAVSSGQRRDGLVAGFATVSANYLQTLGIPVLSGREFTATDESRQDVVVINETLAALLSPGENPVGKRISAIGQREVVGVAKNSSVNELTSTPGPYFYIPGPGDGTTRFLVRHTGAATPLLTAIPAVAPTLDGRQMATAVPFAENVARARRAAGIAATMAGVVGILSLVLACVGIYGVAAYQVSQRTREIGVRMALGARPDQIVSLVLRQNLGAVGIGVAIGLAGALGFGRLLRSLLYGLSPADPAALALAIGILAMTATFAAWPNARRAARIAPASALRQD